jgi:DegV family protein with EDD domain
VGGVQIVTDSACDLTDELAEKHDVTIVPLTIRFGDEELVDRRDLTPAEFWERCRRSPVLPETAAPPPGAFRQAFIDAAEAGYDGVVCVTISSGLSATYQSALTGAEDIENGLVVRVIDSGSVTMGQGLLTLAAAEAAASGGSVAEVAAVVESAIPRTRVVGVLATLDHLQRGGRIGGAAALVGSLLSIKPVIQVRDGVVAEESKQRTRSRSLEYLANKALSDAPLERLAVCSGGATDLDVVLAKLAGISVEHEVVVSDLGPVVGSHAGPGTIGVAYVLPENPAPDAR